MNVVDLVPLCAVILAFGVFMYVLMDGFNLGVGILSSYAQDGHGRDVMMRSIVPVWDGNEVWLVLGGTVLFAVFLVVFAILTPALYFPILLMLLGLLFRGVAFEFRSVPRVRTSAWDLAFPLGSLIATFAQGVVLGCFIEGFPVLNRQFIGGSLDWIRPFSLFTGLCLIVGYGLLGATWLVLKTDHFLPDWARREARHFLLGVLALCAVVCVWTRLAVSPIAVRWRTWPAPFLLVPIPLLTVGFGYWMWRALERRRELAPFVAAMGIFVMCYLGLVISILPYVVPYQLSVLDAAASPKVQEFLLIGTLLLLPIIMTYTGWSYWVFRGKVNAHRASAS